MSRICHTILGDPGADSRVRLKTNGRKRCERLVNFCSHRFRPFDFLLVRPSAPGSPRMVSHVCTLWLAQSRDNLASQKWTKRLLFPSQSISDNTLDLNYLFMKKIHLCRAAAEYVTHLNQQFCQVFPTERHKTSRSMAPSTSSFRRWTWGSACYGSSSTFRPLHLRGSC